MSPDLKKLLTEGHAQTATVKEATILALACDALGHVAHVNQALPGIPPSVELCQGAHCHCRY